MWAIVIFNKVVLVGIGVGVVWALQALVLHPELWERFPFTRSVILRLALSLIGVAVVMDFFSFDYVPSISEIVLNTGMLCLKGFIYYAYVTGQLANGKVKSKI
jgi:hypothetical protein